MPKAGEKWFDRPEAVCKLCDSKCGQDVDQHLRECLGGAEGPGDYQLFECSDQRGVYRLHFVAKATATFEDMDVALRRYWMECCGHLSEFAVLQEPQPNLIPTSAASGVFFFGEQPPPVAHICTKGAFLEDDSDEPYYDQARVQLGQRLGQEKLIALYSYDFGTTTSILVIAGPKVALSPAAAARVFPPGGSRLALVARNQAPAIPCGVCGKQAAKYCWSGGGSNFEERGPEEFWCSYACARRWPDLDGDYQVARLWNSPRAGVCGYDGPDGDLDQSHWSEGRTAGQAQQPRGGAKKRGGSKPAAAAGGGRAKKAASAGAGKGKAAAGSGGSTKKAAAGGSRVRQAAGAGKAKAAASGSRVRQAAGAGKAKAAASGSKQARAKPAVRKTRAGGVAKKTAAKAAKAAGAAAAKPAKAAGRRGR